MKKYLEHEIWYDKKYLYFAEIAVLEAVAFASRDKYMKNSRIGSFALYGKKDDNAAECIIKFDLEDGSQIWDWRHKICTATITDEAIRYWEQNSKNEISTVGYEGGFVRADGGIFIFSFNTSRSIINRRVMYCVIKTLIILGGDRDRVLGKQWSQMYNYPAFNREQIMNETGQFVDDLFRNEETREIEFWKKWRLNLDRPPFFMR